VCRNGELIFGRDEATTAISHLCCYSCVFSVFFPVWNGDEIGATHSVPLTILQFFWLSICNMTTTGYGDVYPVHIAARLMTALQMLVGVCYTVVILGQALASTVAFINSIRVQRGADLLKSSHSRRPDNLPAVEEEEEAEVMSLEKFEGAAPQGEVLDSYTASEAEEEEVHAAPVRAAPARRAPPPQTRASPPPGGAPVPQRRMSPAPAPVGAPPQSRPRPAAPAAASGMGAAAGAGFAPGVIDEAKEAIAESGRELAQATANAARAGAAQARKAAPGVLAAGQKAAAGAKRAAQATAQRASAAVEEVAPGLQDEVRQDARQAAQTVATAARVGGAVAGVVASEAKDRAMANPTIAAAAKSAQPKVAAARQSLAAAAAKAKAAAQQSAEHMRQQSRGMFDPEPEPEQIEGQEEDAFDVQA
jgi:hypothetical protein